MIATVSTALNIKEKGFHIHQGQEPPFMTNAIDTCTAVFPTEKELEAYSLNDADSLVIRAFSNLQTAARVYKREGLTQPQMVERLSKLGVKCSTRAIQRVFAELRKDKDADFQASQKPKAVQKRKERAQHKATNRQIGGMSPTDEPSSPPNFFLSSDTSNNDQSNVEQGDTELFECEVVPDAQPKMGEDYDGCNTSTVPMGATNNGRADEEFNEVLEHIAAIKSISRKHFRPNQPGTWTEHQWLDLTQRYAQMHSIAEGYSREYKQERRDYAEQCYQRASSYFNAGHADRTDRIASDDEILRLL